MEMFTEIATSIGDWATDLVFNPMTWTGIGLVGVSVLLWMTSGWLDGRRLKRLGATGGASAAAAGTPAARLGGSTPSSRSGRSSDPVDDDMADIEAILKNRGIE